MVTEFHIQHSILKHLLSMWAAHIEKKAKRQIDQILFSYYM